MTNTWDAEPSRSDDDARDDAGTLALLMEYVDAVNIADDMDESDLRNLGDTCVREYELDDQSRAKWVEDAEKAMKLATLVAEPKQWPIEEGSANVKYPLITTASLQFAARAYPAIVNGAKVVKSQVTGDDSGQPAMDPTGNVVTLPTGQPQYAVPPGAKRDRGDRVAEHMSWQILNQIDGWEDDMDLLLHQVPVVGCAFKKVYYDPIKRKPVVEYVNALDLIVNHNNTRSMETCPRITHKFTRYPYEFNEMQNAGIWRKCELGPSTLEDKTGNDEQAPHEFIEQHRYMDMDDDGVDEPYILTVHVDTKQVMRIVANFAAEDVKVSAEDDETDLTIIGIDRQNYFVKYDFIPNPEGGFYAIGFGTLLRSLNETINTALNQMLDAATLQNAGGGFIGTDGGIWERQDEVRLQLGKYARVTAMGDDIRKAIVHHNFQGPSTAMFQLLGLMIEAGNEVASIKDVLTGEAPANQPATTTLALIEQGMTTFTAIYSRIHRAFKSELQMLYEINSENLDDQVYFNVLDDQKAVAREDYALGDYDVMPVSDPRLVSDQERKIRAQLLLQLSQSPDIDSKAAMGRFLRDMRFENPEELMAKGAPPKDPLSEMKAFKEFNVALKVKAETIQTITAALKNLADAEKAEPGTQMPQYMAELAALRDGLVAELGAMNGPQDQQGAVPGMAGVPGNAGPVPGAGAVLEGQGPQMEPAPVAAAGDVSDGPRPYARAGAVDQVAY